MLVSEIDWSSSRPAALLGWMTPPSTASTTLLKQFGLTTAAEELVPRLTQAGHHDALPVLVEVLEAEAEARRQRRAARLPPGKTFQTLDTGRLPAPLAQQMLGAKRDLDMPRALRKLDLFRPTRKGVWSHRRIKVPNRVGQNGNPNLEDTPC